MIGKQIDIVRQQQCQTLFHPASHPPVLTTPEQAMVHKNRVRMRGDSGFNKCAAGGDARNYFPDGGATFHLQAIGTIVLKPLWLQQCVKGLQ